jgi:hypothetical protein
VPGQAIVALIANLEDQNLAEQMRKAANAARQREAEKLVEPRKRKRTLAP